MELDCQIKQCFASSGEYESCDASINLVSEKIVIVSKPDFGNPDDLENYMGAEHFEINISHSNEIYNFKLKKKLAKNSFEITKNDMEKFKKFKSSILFHDKLNNNLDCKNIKIIILKI